MCPLLYAPSRGASEECSCLRNVCTRYRCVRMWLHHTNVFLWTCCARPGICAHGATTVRANKKPRNRRRPLFYLGYHREQNGVAIRCRRTQQVGLELFRVCRLPFRIRVSASRCRHSGGGGILRHGRLALAIIAFPRSSLPHGASPGRLGICLCVPRLVRVPSPLTPSQLIHSHPLNCTVAYPHMHN